MKVVLITFPVIAGAVWAARPLDVEDGFTLGRGEIDLEIAGDFARASDDCREWSPGVVAYYGLEESVYAAVGCPLVINRPEGADAASGLGDLFVQTKFRLREWGGAAALFSEAKFPTGDEEKGLGSGTTDVTGMAIVSWPMGPVMGHVNGGYCYAFAAEGEGSGGCPFAAGGGEVTLFGPVGLGAEVAAELEKDEAGKLPITVGGGFTFSLGGKLTLDAGAHAGLAACRGERSFTAGVSWVVR